MRNVSPVIREDDVENKGHTHPFGSITDIPSWLTDGGKAASGADSHTLDDSVDYPLIGFNLYGKSVQDGTPSPDVPMDIVSVGDNGFDIITKDDTHFNLLSVRDSGGDIITKQPVSTVVKIGEKATFTVAASGTGLKYQWQWSADGGKTWKNTSTTAASYSLTAAAAYNGYMYRCVVTDSNGNFETSNESTLYVVSDDCEVKTASIATDALSLCGIPVESGGNYTDSNYNKNLVAAALKVLERNDEGIRADWEKFYRSKHGVEYDNSILDGYGACFCYMYGGKTHICYGDYGTFIRINSDGNYRVTYINNCRKLDTTIYDPPTSMTSDIANSLYGDWRYEDGSAVTEYITPFPEKSVPQFDDPAVSADDLVEFIIEKELNINLSVMYQQWIADELIYNADGTGKIIKNTEIFVFDGSADENWINPYTTTEFTNDFRIQYSKLNGTKAENISSSSTILYCNRLQYNNLIWNNDIAGCQIASIGDFIVRMPSSIIGGNGVTAFKSWLASNPLIIVYQIVPQEIELTSAEVDALRTLQTFNGTTNIYNNGDAEMSVKYCTNKALSEYVLPITKGLQKQIDELRAAVLSLGGNV